MKCCSTEKGSGKSCGCKTLSIVIVALIVAVAVYFGFWKYGANKEVDKRIAEFKQGLSEASPNSELLYDNVSIGGFPTNYDVKIKNPSIVTNSKPVVKFNSLNIKSDLTGKDFEVTLGENIEIINQYGDKTISQTIKYNKPPKIKVNLNDANFPTLLSYEDEGYTIFMNGKQTGSVEKLNLFYSLEEPNEKTTVFKLKAGYKDATSEPLDAETYKNILPGISDAGINKFKKLNKSIEEANAGLDIEFSIVGPKNFENIEMAMQQLENASLDVKRYELDLGESGGIKIAGMAKMEPMVSPMPSIDFTLDINNVDNFFVFFQDVFSVMPELMEAIAQGEELNPEQKQEMEMAKVLFASVDKETVNKVKSFMREISDNPGASADDLSISIKSMPDGNIQVGTLSTAEFMQLLAERFELQPGQPQPQY